MTALSLATHTSRVALRLLAAGFVVAVLVLWAGRAIERSRFGATDADSVAEIEAQLRQRINAAADTLGVTSARIVSSRQLIQSASRDDASVRALFDALAVALPAEPAGRTGITVYSHPGVVPIAWAGRVSDLPKERIEGPAELFVAPRGRLIYVEPVTDPERPAAGRLGTIVVEQLLGDTSVAAPSDEAIVLETTLTPVTLRPALAATATRSPYIFLVPSRGGRVLLEAEVKSGDLAEARDGWRLLTRSAAWAVIGVGLNVSIEPDEFPPDLRRPATSIGHGVGTEDALAAVCEKLDEWVEADRARILADFRERDALRGREVGWVGAGGEGGDGSGVADGIDDRGNLSVVSGEGERLSLGSGEVTLTLSD